jgi:hypothetical protein
MVENLVDAVDSIFQNMMLEWQIIFSVHEELFKIYRDLPEQLTESCESPSNLASKYARRFATLPTAYIRPFLRKACARDTLFRTAVNGPYDSHKY